MGRIRVPRTSQPQGAVGIDWANPLSRGLVFAWIPATDQLLKPGAVGGTVNRYGKGISTNGSSTYEYLNSAPVFDLNECSLTAMLTPQNINGASSFAVSAGQNASANPLFMIGQGATSNQLGFRTRDNAGTDIEAKGASADWANGVSSVVTGTRSKTASLQRVFAAGKQVASIAAGTAAATTFDRFAIGCLLRSSAALFWQGSTNLVLIHNRALSDTEIKSLSANPWQIFQPIARNVFSDVVAGGGSPYTLTAESGSFALTGQATGLAFNRTLAADSGSYALAGQDTGLAFNRVLSADSGSYALAGQDATLTYTPIGGPTYTLTADSGSFALAGQDTALKFNRVLAAESGSFALTGQDATLGAPLFTQAQLDYMLAYCQANLTGLLKRWNGSAWV